MSETQVFSGQKFVDFDGLDYFWGKAKKYIDDKDSEAIGDLDVTDTAVEGEYISSISQENGKIKITRAALPKSSGVAGIDYITDENGNKWIILRDDEGNQIGDGIDASDFVADGMLEGVELTNDNKLKFTFNVLGDPNDPNSGLKEIEVDIAKYIDVYKADGTELKLDEESKTFSIQQVNSNKTVLGQKITIEGGPLADNIKESNDSWPAAWKDSTTGERFIPADASMYDIVMNLFCVEKWPVNTSGNSNITTSGASLVSKVNTPSLTYNGKSTNNAETIVEVGTTVYYEAKSGASSYTATPATAKGFTYGYADANDNTVDSKNTSVSASFGTISAVSDSIPTLTLSGKVSETINGTAATEDAGAASKSDSVVIALGDNKITAKCKSITYSGTCSMLPVYYGCSNLGNTNNNGTTYASTEKTAQTLTSTAVDSGTITINCKGEYKAFVGYASERPMDSNTVRALESNVLTRIGAGACGTAGTKYQCNNNYMVIAVPSGWDFTIKDAFGAPDARNSFFKNDAVVNVKLPNSTEETPVTVAYDVWTMGALNVNTQDLVIIEK